MFCHHSRMLHKKWLALLQNVQGSGCPIRAVPGVQYWASVVPGIPPATRPPSRFDGRGASTMCMRSTKAPRPTRGSGTEPAGQTDKDSVLPLEGYAQRGLSPRARFFGSPQRAPAQIKPIRQRAGWSCTVLRQPHPLSRRRPVAGPDHLGVSVRRTGRHRGTGFRVASESGQGSTAPSGAVPRPGSRLPGRGGHASCRLQWFRICGSRWILQLYPGFGSLGETWNRGGVVGMILKIVSSLGS